LVMEYLEGVTLAARIDRGPLTFDEITDVATELIDGLAHAHDAGVIHRDIKPGNIMLTSVGVKICDFGIATQMRPPGPISAGTTGGLPAMLGSVSYVSPEQADGKTVDPRSDVFSVGCVLYEMITGQRAFSEATPLSTLAAVLKSDPRPLRELNPSAPAALDAVVST